MAGRLVSDPELRQTVNGDPKTTFRIAVNRHRRNGENEATFFPIECFGEDAKFVCANFRKGDSIFIMGRAANYKYNDSTGAEQWRMKVTAEEVKFVDSKKDKELQGGKVVVLSVEEGVPF